MDAADLVLVQIGWEFHLELYEEVAVLVGSLMEWHTKSLDAHELVGLNDHAWLGLYPLLLAIQVCDAHVQARQRLQQRDLLVHQQVRALSLEGLVLLNFNDCNDVAGLDIGHAITLAVECELLAVGRPLVNLNLQSLVVALDLLALAYLASLGHVDGLALPSALITRSRALTIHSWTHLPHNGPHAPTLTSSASLYG